MPNDDILKGTLTRELPKKGNTLETFRNVLDQASMLFQDKTTPAFEEEIAPLRKAGLAVGDPAVLLKAIQSGTLRRSAVLQNIFGQVTRMAEAEIERPQREQEAAIRAEQLKALKLENSIANIELAAQSGIDLDSVPQKFFNDIDTSMDWTSGISRGLMELQMSEHDADSLENIIDRGERLSGLLKNIDTSVALGNIEYMGVKGNGIIEKDDDGNAYLFITDEAGNMTKKFLGNVGRSNDGWEMAKVGEIPFNFNPSTGEWRSFESSNTGWGELQSPGQYTGTMPDGFGGLLPLQCGEAVNMITGQMVGNTFEEKKSRIDNKITADTVVPGNTVVFNAGGTTGHVAVVSKVYTDPSGRRKLRLAESNWKGSGVLSYDREVYADDPSIEGFMNTQAIGQFATGTDNSLSAAVALAQRKAEKFTMIEGRPHRLSIVDGREQLTPVEVEGEAEAQKAILDKRIQKTVLTLGSIKTALQTIEDNPWVTGFWAARTASLEFSPSFNFDQQLQPIRASLGFGELTDMRAESKTGGALGQVSEIELILLIAAKVSLALGQGDQLKTNLEKVQTHFANHLMATTGQMPEQYKGMDLAQLQAKKDQLLRDVLPEEYKSIFSDEPIEEGAENLRDRVREAGWDYDALKAAGHTDEEIKLEFGF